MAATFEGMVEIAPEGHVNYLLFETGAVQSAYMAGMQGGSLVDRVSRLFDSERRALRVIVRRWGAPQPLPVQAPTSLVQAYRDLATALVLRLVAEGRESAPAIAEHARQTLAGAHPALEGLSFSGRTPRAVIADADALTNGIAALINELLWTASDQEGSGPAAMLRELMHDRRHLFQSAGLYDRIAWKLT
jgi:hypothetical protein